MAFGKKTIKEKFNNAARKFLLWTGLAAAAGGPFAYEYGTIQTQTVKVINYDGDMEHGFTLKTDKGNFNIERSRLHLQSKQDTYDLWWPINTGETYDIKTYGWHLLGNWQPNILDAQKVSQEELDKRAADLKKQKDKDKTNTSTTTTQTGNNTTSTTPALSGQMVTVNVIVNGYNVQITIPVEAAGKVTINSVAPVVQTSNVVPNANTQPANNPNPPTP